MIYISDRIDNFVKIEELIVESFKIPFTRKFLVNKKSLLELFENLKEQLITDVEEAKQVVSNKSVIISESYKRSKEMIKAAEEKVYEILDNVEITKKAYNESEKITQKINDEILEQIEEIDKYNDEVLEELEKIISNLIIILHKRISERTKKEFNLDKLTSTEDNNLDLKKLEQDLQDIINKLQGSST